MTIPYGRQAINQEDIDSVVKVLESDFLTQGPKVPLFEELISHFCDVDHAVAVNSATSALHIACLALGLTKGDYLWTSPNTFVASANVGLLCGAQVDFVDINEQTYNMCADALAVKLKQAREDGNLPKVVIPVHFAGQPCDMKRIYNLSKEYGFNVIEDASHAISAQYCGEAVGNSRYSDITVFSFHPVKIITTAEGGVATTRSAELAEKMRLYRSHGVTRDTSTDSSALRGDWYYEQVDLGLNYRMTELQAALGVSQLHRVNDFFERRHEIANAYHHELKNLPITLPFQERFSESSYHLFPIKLETETLRKSVFDEMRKQGIGVHVHYIPVHTQPFYKKQGFGWGQYPNAESYYKKALSIPIHQSMTDEDISTVIKSLKELTE